LPRELEALPRRNGFRLRGLDMTRLEAFVDATFAFAVTMLVIAGQQVPDDIEALLGAFKNVPAFAASIGVLAIFWRGHWLWSRRYGLEDGISIAISWAMIFTMLIYVYPLKLVFNGMFYFISHGAVGSRIGMHTVTEARAVFALYAIGFSAIAVEIAVLNVHAWKLRVPLRLNQREQAMTWAAIIGWSLPASVGITSLVLALTLPRDLIQWSGWIYFSMLILVPLESRWTERRLSRLRPNE
jgi:uncharacterized membrane protein